MDSFCFIDFFNVKKIENCENDNGSFTGFFTGKSNKIIEEMIKTV